MKPHFSRPALAVAFAALFASSAFTAQAADFSLSGHIAVQKDVVQIDFTLATAGSNVKIWTDSWQSGLNFDPSLALWSATAGNHSLVADVDDNDTVAAGQGFFDAGLTFPTLAAGSYRVTLVASSNTLNGTLLSQGFAYDSAAPIAIGLWNQPGYDVNANDQKGSFWCVQLSGVDAVTAVPEPGSWALMGLGLLGLAAAVRRSAKA